MTASTLTHPSTSSSLGVPARPRLLSLDAVRGLAVVGMLLVNNAGVAAAMPAQLRHSQAGGLTVADLVFPLFLFVGGVGSSLSGRTAPASVTLRRCAVLFVLGCLLVSAKYHHLSPSTGVLQHIAIATLAAWCLLQLPRAAQPWAWAGALVATWALPTFFALPGTVAGSWDQADTLSTAVERLVTGHVGREQVVASVVSGLTVLAGVAAGRTVRQCPGREGVRRLLLAGSGALVGGLLLARWVPIDKTLWTPSFVLVTAGICAAVFAAAVALLDRPGAGAGAFVQPLRVLGANAIAVYVVTTLLFTVALAPVRDALVVPLRLLWGDTVAALSWASASVLIGWALCQWMWRRSILVKV